MQFDCTVISITSSHRNFVLLVIFILLFLLFLYCPFIVANMWCNQSLTGGVRGSGSGGWWKGSTKIFGKLMGFKLDYQFMLGPWERVLYFLQEAKQKQTFVSTFEFSIQHQVGGGGRRDGEGGNENKVMAERNLFLHCMTRGSIQPNLIQFY